MKTQVFLILQVCLILASCSDASDTSDSSDVFNSFSGAAYTALTGAQKLDKLWTQITANTTSLGWYSILTQAYIFVESMTPTFATYSDVLPVGRKLLTHTTGTVGQVQFIAEKGFPYTGIFEGASNAIMRFATAGESDPTGAPYDNFNPAFGLKILRDGVPSANILAMYSADGQFSWNPFSCDWSNHIPAANSSKIKMLVWKFKQATPYTERLGVKDCAQFNESGYEYSDSQIEIPFQLVFSPTSEVSGMFPDTFSELLADQIQQIPAGTNIYDVLAIEQPYGEAVKIGTLQSKTKFVTSRFGDKHLFFRHNFVEQDLALHPEWTAAMQVAPPMPYTKVGI